jgi:prepilin signal peptidase PulO-like enzyme (type II secretory pathway)
MLSTLYLPIFFGVVVGVLINYLADVMPRNRKLTLPVCLNCGEPRTTTEFLQGRTCKSCGKNNGKRYWPTLTGAIGLSVLVWLNPLGSLPFWCSEILLLVFFVIILTDLEFRVILNEMSIAGCILAIPIGWYLHGWLKTFLGGLCGFLLFLGLYYLGKVFVRRLSRDREEPVDEEALGFGDVYLAGIIGFLAGFPYILPALLAAIVLGGIVSAFFLLFSVIRKKYQAFEAIPYGPFIIIGGIFVLYYYLVVR